MSHCAPVCLSRREVRVSWQTAAAGKPLVKFGLSPGSYSQQQFGTYSTYTAADLCSQPANAWGYSTPGFINTAVLQGLQPNTTYYYMFGDEVGGGGCVVIGACTTSKHWCIAAWREGLPIFLS